MTDVAAGTPSGYNRRGCRCPECREAHRIYNRGLRDKARRRAEINPEMVPHGTKSGYVYWGCRCPRCKRVMAGRK